MNVILTIFYETEQGGKTVFTVISDDKLSRVTKGEQNNGKEYRTRF